MNSPSEFSNVTGSEHDRDPPSGPLLLGAETFVLSVVWCRDEPWRIGEVLLVPAGAPAPTVWFGRGPAQEQGGPKSLLGQQRPGQWLPSPPLGAPNISRYQLELQAADDEILVQNRGRAALLHNDGVVTEARVREGDLLQLGRQLLLLCCRRPLDFGRQPQEWPPFAFGTADAHGIVGESGCAWQLRQHIAFLAKRVGHVFVHGASGSGKELVIQALHSLSSRGVRPLVSRNAATLPEALVDSELFGSCNDYPSPGMPERPGLIGAAHGSTLFLDEFAELPVGSQSHLLRTLDRGEYQRMGETAVRHSDFRLIAATNRGLGPIQQDVLARFPFTLQVPDLNRRREDIPLLLRHVLRQDAELGDAVALGCFAGGDTRLQPSLPLSLVRTLVQLDYTTNVRQLKAELWRGLARMTAGSHSALGSSTPAGAAAQREPLAADARPVHAALRIPSERSRSTEPPRSSQDDDEGLGPGRIQAALDRNNGFIEATWRELGLRNRFVLIRLIKRHNLEIRKRPSLAPGREPKR